MSRCGFPQNLDHIQVFYSPASWLADLDLGRIQLMSMGHDHVAISAHEFGLRYGADHYPPRVRGLQGDPIRKLYGQITSIQRLYDWNGRYLYWHLVDNYWSAPSKDTTSRFRYFEFRLEPIPEV